MNTQPADPAAGPDIAAAGLDVSVAHPARRYDYWLDGKDNYAADRASGDAIARAFPSIRTAARENRAFLHRAVRYLTGQAGIRQFLDIGTGIPTSPNTHEIAQAIYPRAQVVYVDNDPLVMSHAQALLTSHPAGATAFVHADLRQPDGILAGASRSGILDMTQPVGLLLVAVLHFLAPDDDPHRVVGRLIKALPAGSYLAISHVTADYMSTEQAAQVTAVNQAARVHFRSKPELGPFVAGLDLVPPGLVSIVDWKPAPPTARDRRRPCNTTPRPTSAQVSCYGAVARIPGMDAV